LNFSFKFFLKSHSNTTNRLKLYKSENSSSRSIFNFSYEK
jgi:hypothetical protein